MTGFITQRLDLGHHQENLMFKLTPEVMFYGLAALPVMAAPRLVNSKFSQVSLILVSHPQLQWFHVQIGDVTLISKRNQAVLRIVYVPIRFSMVMEVALLVTTSQISCPLILLLPVH